MTNETQGDRDKARPLSATQRWLLGAVREATDRESALHKHGLSDVAGLVARGSTIASLLRRGFVTFGGWCAEIDGDGFGRTGNDDAPWYAITAEGRAALAAKGAA